MNKDVLKAPETGKMHYSFILFVIENGTHSKHARENLERLCKKWLPGSYHIDEVDVVKNFQTALDYNILLTPAVVITNPEPRMTIHGDLSDARSFVEALHLDQEEKNDS
ncbi:MAG: circadian clock KaiB family protein [Balneolaceae bacterium]